MKTIIKIALIAAITVLVTLSCEPGNPEPHNEWWDEYNKQYDGSTYINVPETEQSFTINNNISIGANKVNTISITFPNEADVLKKNDT
jgi:uncharacterized membrane protein